MKLKKLLIPLTAALLYAAPPALADDFKFVLEDLEAGLESFTMALAESTPVAQTSSNQWAQAWIGKLAPSLPPHFGFGVNVGAASLDMTGILDAVESMGMDRDDIPTFKDRLVFPSVTADIRIGGIILPFDVGFSIFKVSNSLIDSVSGQSDVLGDGITVDYTAVGGDIRYAIVQDGPAHSRVSVSAGFYYTGGDVDFKTDEVAAGVHFRSKTFTLGTQASAKLAKFFIPYVGGRLLFSKTSLDYDITPAWTEIFDDKDSVTDASFFNGLPSGISGGASSKLQFWPQVYGGFGLDLLILDLTFGVSYTVISNVVGASMSVRLSL